MLKTAFFGIGTLVAGAALLAGWGALSACQNLDDTSPLFNPDAATDYDAGYVPAAVATDDGTSSSSGTPPPGTTANTIRIRLANLTQGGQALQLCFAQGTGAYAVAHDVATAQKLDAVAASTVSAPVSVGLITSAATGKFSFRVGPDCATPAGSLASVTPTTTFKGGASLTLIVAGDPSAADNTDPLYPKLVSVTDSLSPSASSTSLRAAHGAVGLPPFDVVVNGDTVLTGVRFNTAVGYPYTSTSGYATIAAGIPAGSPLVLRSGTTVKNFTVPQRVRRGIADTLIVTGTLNSVSAQICSDRAPAAGATTADCFALSPN